MRKAHIHRKTFETDVDIELNLDSNKVEVKVCINEYNYDYIGELFAGLIDMGVKFLSVNFVFDIQNSNLLHEVKELKKLRHVFDVINIYKEYFTLISTYNIMSINNNNPSLII